MKNIKKIIKSLMLVVFLSYGISVISPLHADELTKKIVLVGSNSTKESFHGKWLMLIYTEAFKRIGYTLEYKAYPAKRASMLSDAGKVDGEINRVYSYSNKHPNMIRVPQSHYSAYFVAYGTDSSLKLDGWESLKAGDYKIGYRNGVKKTETNLTKHINKDRLLITTSNLQGLQQSLLGRTKVFVDVRHNIIEIISSNDKLKNSNIQELGIMEKVNVHSFLHKKNAHLVPLLSKALSQMKEEGLILTYKEKVKQLK